MLNAFLTHILQVIIVLDMVGIVAYFILSTRRRRNARLVPPTVTPLPGNASPRPSLWAKLTGAKTPWRPAPAAAGGGAASLDGALQQLRRVLDGYGRGLE